MSGEAQITAEFVTGPATWAEMGPSERLEFLAQSILGGSPPEAAARIVQRVREHFGPEGPQDFFDAANVILRESWREDHGEVATWDANLAASGRTLPPNAMEELAARKSTMTEPEVTAELKRLRAPQPKVVGLVRWRGAVKRPGDRMFVPVMVEWPRDGSVPVVTVSSRKVNARQRRRWLDLLAQKGVTREAVTEAVEQGRERVSTGDDE